MLYKNWLWFHPIRLYFGQALPFGLWDPQYGVQYAPECDRGEHVEHDVRPERVRDRRVEEYSH